jgi:hypothetical protein
MKLFVVYLGGELVPGRIGEDHEVVFVVAEDVAAARKLARKKWQGSGRAHIDAVAALEAVDGYRVSLEPGAGDDVVVLDTTYVP